MFRLASTVASQFSFANNRIHPSKSRLNWVRDFCAERNTIYVPNSIGNDGGASFLELFSGRYHGSAVVMSKAVAIEGRKALDAGADYGSIVDGFNKAEDVLEDYLESRVQTLSSSEEMLQVAKKLAHGDKRIGEIVAKAIEKDGNVFESLGVVSHRQQHKRVKEWLDESKVVTEDDFMRVEVIRSVKVVKAAMSGGSIELLPGGMAELVHASKALNKLPTENSSEKIGIQLLQNALKMPMFTFASITGLEGSTVVQKLLMQDNHDLGFDFFTGEFINEYKPESMIEFYRMDDMFFFMARKIDHGSLLCLDEMVPNQNDTINQHYISSPIFM